jgi:hypothetical protein
LKQIKAPIALHQKARRKIFQYAMPPCQLPLHVLIASYRDYYMQKKRTLAMELKGRQSDRDDNKRKVLSHLRPE